MRATVQAVLGVLACITILAAGLNDAHAAVPSRINYQGYLTDAGGLPINTTVSATFKLYDAPAGGSELFTETQNVAVANGIFNVQLGSTVALNLPFDVPYYLGVSIGGEAEMVPRQSLVSAPYSLRTLKADSVADGAITGNAIPDQSVPPSKLSGPACSNGNILRYNGSEWVCVQQFGGTVPNPPISSEPVLNYNPAVGGVVWRKAYLVCGPTYASTDFANGTTGYVTATCPAGQFATGGSFSSGNAFGLSMTHGINNASCYFWNNSGAQQTFICAVTCCSIGFGT